MYIIYLIQNIYNGKRYVGQTHKTLEERWHGHVYFAQAKQPGKNKPYFIRALAKYGPQSFNRTILETVETQEEADESEKKWIKFLDTTEKGKGYNLTLGGGGGILTPEALANLSRGIRESPKVEIWRQQAKEERERRLPPWRLQQLICQGLSCLKIAKLSFVSSAAVTKWCRDYWGKSLLQLRKDWAIKLKHGRTGHKESETTKAHRRELERIRRENPNYVKRGRRLGTKSKPDPRLGKPQSESRRAKTAASLKRAWKEGRMKKPTPTQRSFHRLKKDDIQKCLDLRFSSKEATEILKCHPVTLIRATRRHFGGTYNEMLREIKPSDPSQISLF